MPSPAADQPPPVPAETITAPAPRRAGSPSARLETLVEQIPVEGLTVAVLRDLVGQEGLLVLTILLTLVFMIPVSIPGVSTVFGACILLIGVSRLLGRTFWLPRRLAARVLPADKLRAGLRQGARWLRRMESILRPGRLASLASDGPAAAVNNAGLVVGAVLLMAPLAMIPFSNTLPALALLFLALGLLERDGVCILLGHLANLASMAYFGTLAIGGMVAVRAAFRALFGGGQ